MQPTVSTKGANRQAGKQRNDQFEALAAFANLGDTPDSWATFRLHWPQFFPDWPMGFSQPGFRNLTEWLYTSAEKWAALYSEIKAFAMPSPPLLPPLLWYRDLLRAVWTRKDPNGAALCFLLGFEKQARALGLDDVAPTDVIRPALVPGQSLNPNEQVADVLPPGRPVVNGITGIISWEFGCQFQSALYNLIQNRWLAMVCPECGKYFIANKTAQKFCSTRCYGKKKGRSSLEFYHRKGRFLRDAQRDKVKRSAKKKGK